MSLHFEWKPQDLWIGVYWRGWERVLIDESDNPFDLGTPYDVLDIWICLIPCIPLHLHLQRKREVPA